VIRPCVLSPDDGGLTATATAISPIADIVEDARNGRPFILVDVEDRENEAAVVIPAQFATPEQINFMAKHARGLICLSITGGRARELRLPPMATQTQPSRRAAFTVSIEAREGVTTGISAHDRAHTIAVAVNPAKGADDLVSPGHVFPRVAQPGGVLVRPGHTEAAVDISRLAGLTATGVTCEIMTDDGAMARLPDLVAFAQRHGMRIGAIADLVAYRRRTERQVERVIETPFESVYGGRFRMLIYRNVLDRTEHVALLHGKIDPTEPTLVWTHEVDMVADLLGHVAAPQDSIPRALNAIARHNGAGVAVFLRSSSPGGLSQTYGHPEQQQDNIVPCADAVGAQILLDLGVRNTVLLTTDERQRQSEQARRQEEAPPSPVRAVVA
jgi:3,4-dihydroxy 2-butanone 4-phosphate synthase/GTP cyclohydrolase II